MWDTCGPFGGFWDHFGTIWDHNRGLHGAPPEVLVLRGVGDGAADGRRRGRAHHHQRLRTAAAAARLAPRQFQFQILSLVGILPLLHAAKQTDLTERPKVY